MDYSKTYEFIQSEFTESVIPTLCEYIKVDNLSPNYDLEWDSNGKAEVAAQILLDWVLKQNLEGLKAEILKQDNLTPVLLVQIESNGGKGNVFMYGHFDKQPHFSGWDEDLGPCKPVIKGDYLYGRGGADDGYAIFSCVESIKLCQKFGAKHGRVVILIEGSEESGSIHLMNYIDLLGDVIGEPDLLICMDSGCMNYEGLWLTSSLRGVAIQDITVEVLQEAVHSGVGTGIAPDSFMILRNLLERIEDSKTGQVNELFRVEIPKLRVEQAIEVGKLMKEEVIMCKMLPGVETLSNDYGQLLLNNTWEPTITITGATGFPAHITAGNVLRASTSMRLSMRLPPTLDEQKAGNDLYDILTKDPPFNAKITVNKIGNGSGWNNRDLSEKLIKSLNNSSNHFFGKDFLEYGMGGSIPFINTLFNKFKGDFLVMGILGPNSNAHAPNEALHIPYCQKLTTILGHIVSDYSQ